MSRVSITLSASASTTTNMLCTYDEQDIIRKQHYQFIEARPEEQWRILGKHIKPSFVDTNKDGIVNRRLGLQLQHW